MTLAPRHLRRTDLPAFFIFATVYLAALALVVSPSSLRNAVSGVTDPSGFSLVSKEKP